MNSVIYWVYFMLLYFLFYVYYSKNSEKKTLENSKQEQKMEDI